MEFIYRRCRKNLWSLVISNYFHKTTNKLWIKNSKMTEPKDCKGCQENVSLSLAKRRLGEMNESFLINQVRSCMLLYTSPVVEKVSFFFCLPYLEYNFMIANLVRINLAVLKISEPFQDDSRGGVLC